MRCVRTLMRDSVDAWVGVSRTSGNELPVPSSTTGIPATTAAFDSRLLFVGARVVRDDTPHGPHGDYRPCALMASHPDRPSAGTRPP